jgi:hypothetical protein
VETLRKRLKLVSLCSATPALARDLPQRLHVLPRDDLVLRTAQHENRCCGRDARDLRGGVPFLKAEEGEGADYGPGADDAREGLECVLDDEGGDLWALSNRGEREHWRKYFGGIPAREVDRDCTAEGCAV